MDVQVSQSSLSGSVEAPPSKSYSHRALVIAGLTQKKCQISNLLPSNDVNKTINALKKIGAEITTSKDTTMIMSSMMPPDTDIDCGNSGTTLRFMTGICSLITGSTTLTGSPALQQRPMQALIDALNTLGAQVVSINGNGYAPIQIHGPRQGGTVKIPDSKSSQFVSSLILSSPTLNEKTTIIAPNPKSQPYIDMTIEVMNAFGFSISKKNTTYVIPENQEGRSINYDIPGDWSSAAVMIAAGVLAGKVKVCNLSNDQQGDRVITEILSKMGANIKSELNCINAEHSQLTGITINCSNMPDLVPIIAALGAYANGITKITGAEHLRYKESNRIEALASEYSRLGINVAPTKDGLILRGPNQPHGIAHSKNDHRLAMSLILLGLQSQKGVRVQQVQCIADSYPSFLNDIINLGAQIHELHR